MGMLTRGGGAGLNFIVPLRRILPWAKTMGVEWALDPTVKVTAIPKMCDGTENGRRVAASSARSGLHQGQHEGCSSHHQQVRPAVLYGHLTVPAIRRGGVIPAPLFPLIRRLTWDGLAWKRVSRIVDAPNRKRDFKKALHRRNRRKAKQNPETKDKPLDARDFD